MMIKELKEIIKDLPDDADVIMQKKVTKRESIVAQVTSSSIIDAPDNIHKRLVLMNLKPVKKRNL